MIQSIKNSSKNPDINFRVRALIEGFCHADDGNVVIVTANSEQKASHIYIQSSNMRRLAASFPEIVYVDSTFNTNNSDYNLFSFMVKDSFGIGQFILHSLMESETQENMERTIQAFKECNPRANDVRVIIVDKDMKEIRTLSKAFPSARILLCQYHVIAYFDKIKGMYIFEFIQFRV